MPDPDDNLIPPGWRYIVKPPLPEYEYAGNLILQLGRPNGNTQEVVTADVGL